MVKTKNANVGQGQNLEEGGTSRGKGKAKGVPSGVKVPEVKVPDRFILAKEAASFEEWTRNRRKIAPSHRVDLNDMQGMEAIPHLFELIGWIPLLIENELWVYGYRTHASHTILFNQMLALWMLHYQNFSILCDQFGWDLVGISGHIGHGKIYNQQTFKRKGFEKNEEGAFIQGGKGGDDDDEEDDDEDQEGMSVEEEESEEETEAEIQRRETRQKKRQERIGEGSSSGSMSQLMEMIASLQTSMNTRFKAFDGHFEVLDGKVSDIQERLDALDNKMTDTQEWFMRLEQGGEIEMIEIFLFTKPPPFPLFFYNSFFFKLLVVFS
ncbi:hypothetical protein M9H77_04561 [Catharanthus roseus]|uniref:Uncharacterized protein n=1 Tax=Catharanthus roseus TaxID=4058 RepID=A0ACC0CED3_CATRO|nr:hypothetical protein M9H77_04561 [Catharanthus roseus]